MAYKLFVHIVTYNSAATIVSCVISLLQQQFEGEILIHVTDNCSADCTAKIIAENFGDKISLTTNTSNLGFCAAHNQGVKRFLDGGYDLLFIANPDLALENNALSGLANALSADSDAGMATPKLYRADTELKPIFPRIFDACGMIFDSTLRHFDRGSEEKDNGHYNTQEYVFGGTGAALMLKRQCVDDLLLVGEKFERDAEKIYPQLAKDRALRAPLFDEAFFAYREDAELAWRSKILGWKTLYVPKAIGYHTRVVLPERRSELPPKLNSWSVRNRFLMQIVNFSFSADLRAVMPGLLFRNLLVILGVLLKERSSLEAFHHLWILKNRALERRRALRYMHK